jgi:GTP-binding protein Era/rRNA maturation RNase YbeY
MKLFITDDTEKLEEVQLKLFEGYITKLKELIFEEDNEYLDPSLRKLFEDSYVNLTFVSREDIKDLNMRIRDIDKETDVLSFPMVEMHEGKLSSGIEDIDMEYDEDGNKILNVGDIIICPDVAYENADVYGHSAEREIAFLAAHSFLHLIGYDHIEERDEKIMRKHQRKLMKDIGLEITEDQSEITDHRDEREELVVYPAGSICEHVGYVALLGRPNVGKSTLINYITGMKVAIVSHKPQTTRTNIRSIYNTDNAQIIFTDTPGVHKPGSRLGEIMVSNSFYSAKNADAVLLIVDGRFKEPGKVELDLLRRCKENNKKVILAVNKADEVSKESLLPIIKSYSEQYEFKDIIPISARDGENVDVLLDSLTALLPEGPRLFDTEYMTDQTEREISAELIREQLLHYTNQEIPHGTTVEIEKFEEKYKEDSADEYDRDRVVIRAAIICERNSHKGIIIGKNGSMIKRIGTSARIAIERLVGCKVYLDLFVKVREDWKNNEILLKDYGFQQEGDEKDGI